MKINWMALLYLQPFDLTRAEHSGICSTSSNSGWPVMTLVSGALIQVVFILFVVRR